MGQYVHQALQEGLCGWQVTDCIVTMTECIYSVPDGPPSRRGPLSTAADFRKLTPLVLMQALTSAGTVVCEPTVRVILEIPTGAIGAVSAALGRLGAGIETPSLQRELSVIETVVLESSFAGYQPVSVAAPTRRRTTATPLDREE